MRPSSGRCCCPGRFDGVADGGDFAAHGASRAAPTLKLLVSEVAVALAGVGDGLQVDVFTDQGDFVLGEQGGASGCEGAVLGAQAEAAFVGREHAGGSLGAGAGAGAFAGGVAQEGRSAQRRRPPGRCWWCGCWFVRSGFGCRSGPGMARFLPAWMLSWPLPASMVVVRRVSCWLLGPALVVLTRASTVSFSWRTCCWLALVVVVLVVDAALGQEFDVLGCAQAGAVGCLEVGGREGDGALAAWMSILSACTLLSPQVVAVRVVVVAVLLMTSVCAARPSLSGPAGTAACSTVCCCKSVVVVVRVPWLVAPRFTPWVP